MCIQYFIHYFLFHTLGYKNWCFRKDTIIGICVRVCQYVIFAWSSACCIVICCWLSCFFIYVSVKVFLTNINSFLYIISQTLVPGFGTLFISLVCTSSILFIILCVIFKDIKTYVFERTKNWNLCACVSVCYFCMVVCMLYYNFLLLVMFFVYVSVYYVFLTNVNYIYCIGFKLILYCDAPDVYKTHAISEHMQPHYLMMCNFRS